MTLEEARQFLELGQRASHHEVRAAYRRAARRWHPDRAPAAQEGEYRRRMQQLNTAYQRIIQYIEGYRIELVESSDQDDLMKWWHNRFATGVWSPPPAGDPGEDRE
ncbi:MAG: DnaJ domain-containing protein [Desulfobaccales bacterium]